MQVKEADLAGGEADGGTSTSVQGSQEAAKAGADCESTIILMDKEIRDLRERVDELEDFKLRVNEWSAGMGQSSTSSREGSSSPLITRDSSYLSAYMPDPDQQCSCKGFPSDTRLSRRSPAAHSLSEGGASTSPLLGQHTCAGGDDGSYPRPSRHCNEKPLQHQTVWNEARETKLVAESSVHNQACLPQGAIPKGRCTSWDCQHQSATLEAPKSARSRVMTWGRRWKREKGDPRWTVPESPPGSRSSNPTTRALVAKLESFTRSREAR